MLLLGVQSTDKYESSIFLNEKIDNSSTSRQPNKNPLSITETKYKWGSRSIWTSNENFAIISTGGKNLGKKNLCCVVMF